MSDRVLLLPGNSSQLQRDLLGSLTSVLGLDESKLRDLWSPDDCPESFLAFLAWSLSVDNWSPSWPLATKRTAVRESIETHRRKGTIGSIRRALSVVGLGVVIVEWWQPEGIADGYDPHEFSVTLTTGGESVTLPQQELALRILLSSKPLRSSLRNIDVLPGIGDAMLYTSCHVDVGYLVTIEGAEA